MNLRIESWRLCCVVLTGSLVWTTAAAADEAPQWRIFQTDNGWRLLKDEQPVYLQGAVGSSHWDVLRACGGNAVRVNANKKNLDEAHYHRLMVMANLPVRGERNGMNWGDAEQVDDQKRKVLAVVEELRGHPALLFWAVGNELDHIPGEKSHHPQLWKRLNELAAAIKQIDARHPVLTVVGTGRYQEKVQHIARDCPDFDLLGINSYGDLASVTTQTREHWPKPYVIAEWGPTGHWQVPKTKWGAPREQTSSEKANIIGDRYQTIILADKTHCLGSFIFYWSEKQETTHTWYGLFYGGLRTESIDVMQRAWSGAWPKNRAPGVQGLAIEGFSDPRAVYLRPAQSYRAGVQATDPESDPLTFAWSIRPEVEIPPDSYAGSKEQPAKTLEGLIRNPGSSQINFTAPQTAGPYRLFVTIADGQGNVAYGNIPFFVTTPE